MAELASPVVRDPIPHSANAAVAARMECRCAGVVHTPRSVPLTAASRPSTAPVLAWARDRQTAGAERGARTDLGAARETSAGHGLGRNCAEGCILQ